MYQFKEIKVVAPKHDCDILIELPGGSVVTVQLRPSNADINYNGSLDIILPYDQAVTNWKGCDMQAAEEFEGHPHIRIAQQLVTELPLQPSY